MTRKGELGCPNCDGPCLGCWESPGDEVPFNRLADLGQALRQRDEALAKLRESQAECAKLKVIYASAVTGRAEMRTALKNERAKRPFGITEWSTVESVERIIAEREVARAECAALRAGADDLLRDHERDLEALHVTREQLSMAVALLQERTRENDDECAKFLATFENNKQETK